MESPVVATIACDIESEQLEIEFRHQRVPMRKSRFVDVAFLNETNMASTWLSILVCIEISKLEAHLVAHRAAATVSCNDLSHMGGHASVTWNQAWHPEFATAASCSC